MDGSDLDALCLWIYTKRKYCFDKEVTKEYLLQPSEPKNSISVPEDNVLLCFEENASDDILMRIEQISQICYMPVCKEWQKDRCNSLGLPYIHGNIEHHTTQVMVPVNLCPSSTARIVADGNCFFRSLSFVLTGSQDYHQEVRLLVTTYMIDNTGNPQLSSLIKDGERMENYIEQSKMQLLGTWATELKSSLQLCYFKLQSMSMDLVERVTSGKSMRLKVKKKQTFITMNALTLLIYP
ncbi:hypothetical protein EMCRGX_G006988, partial [Ephydatia muelleri]